MTPITEIIDKKAKKSRIDSRYFTKKTEKHLEVLVHKVRICISKQYYITTQYPKSNPTPKQPKPLYYAYNTDWRDKKAKK